MDHPTIPETGSNVTAESHEFLARCRTVDSFRGLLDVHSRYGLPARRATIIARCLEGSGGFVTSTAAPIATGRSDPDAGWELHPLKIHDFHGTPHRVKYRRLVPVTLLRPRP